MGKDPTVGGLPRRDRAQQLADLFVILAGCLGAVSFWSTALAEISGILLLLVASLHAIVSLERGGELLPESPGILRPALLLVGLYAAAILASILLSGLHPALPFFPNAGLLWHPLLLPAALSVPMKPRPLKIAGILFLLSGAVCAPVTLMLNLARNQDGPLFAFTGLTTFADLLVLAGTVAASLLFPSGRPGKPAWRFVVPGLMIAMVLAWSGERAPVMVLAAAGGARFAGAGHRRLAAGVLIAGACLLLGPPPLSEKMEWLIRGNPVDRFVVWEEGLKQVPHAPLFGHGPGSYPQVLPAGAWGRFVNRAPSSWHNDMLETWLDSGLLAAGAFGGLLFLGVSRAVRSAFPRGRWRYVRLRSEPGLLFLCLALFGLVGSVVTTSVLGLAFWLLLGLTLNARRGKITPLTTVPRSS